jgi:hypothetical protein
MRTDSQAAPESAPSVAGGAQSRGRSRAWRLPIAYRAIPATALAVDLALIFASAIGAEILYHSLPYDLEGEFAHTIAAATFVAVLFVAAMRVQKLYSPNRLILMDDQARSVLSAWCGAFLILASGVFTWGVSHDLSRGDVLLSGLSAPQRCSRTGCSGGLRCHAHSKAARCVDVRSSA